MISSIGWSWFYATIGPCYAARGERSEVLPCAAAQMDGSVHCSNVQFRAAVADGSVGVLAGIQAANLQREIRVDGAVHGIGVNVRHGVRGHDQGDSAVYRREVERAGESPDGGVDGSVDGVSLSSAGGAQENVAVDGVAFGVGIKRFRFHDAVHGAGDKAHTLGDANGEVDADVVVQRAAPAGCAWDAIVDSRGRRIDGTDGNAALMLHYAH